MRHFPQNVNIAGVLPLAGIGFDRKRRKIVADLGPTHNAHTIRRSGKSGCFTVVLEKLLTPGDPQAAWFACCSALAAIKELGNSAR